jgi:hypothetical protein
VVSTVGVEVCVSVAGSPVSSCPPHAASPASRSIEAAIFFISFSPSALNLYLLTPPTGRNPRAEVFHVKHTFIEGAAFSRRDAETQRERTEEGTNPSSILSLRLRVSA